MQQMIWLNVFKYILIPPPPPPLTVSFFPLLTDKQKLKIDFKIVTTVIINRINEIFFVL